MVKKYRSTTEKPKKYGPVINYDYDHNGIDKEFLRDKFYYHRKDGWHIPKRYQKRTEEEKRKEKETGKKIKSNFTAQPAPDDNDTIVVTYSDKYDKYYEKNERINNAIDYVLVRRRRGYLIKYLYDTADGDEYKLVVDGEETNKLDLHQMSEDISTIDATQFKEWYKDDLLTDDDFMTSIYLKSCALKHKKGANYAAKKYIREKACYPEYVSKTGMSDQKREEGYKRAAAKRKENKKDKKENKSEFDNLDPEEQKALIAEIKARRA